MIVDFANLLGNDTRVSIIGDFTDWKPIDISTKLHRFILTDGIYIYRYIINDKVKCSDVELTTIRDDEKYNYIVITDGELNKEYCEMSIPLNNPYVFTHYATQYKHIGDYDKMKSFYIKAINGGYVCAMYMLSHYYYNVEHNSYLATKYAKMAFSRKYMPAIPLLSLIYLQNKMLKQLTGLCYEIMNDNTYDTLAVSHAIMCLSTYYSKIVGDHSLAQHYLNIAVEKGNPHALREKVKLCKAMGLIHDTVKYLRIGIDNGNRDVLYLAGNYYYEIGEKSEAIKYWKMAVDKNSRDAMYALYSHSDNESDRSFYLNLYNTYIYSAPFEISIH